MIASAALQPLTTNGTPSEIAEQMKRLDTDIGSIDAALEQAPEVFQSVSVNQPVNVLDSVIYHLMRVFASKAIV